MRYDLIPFDTLEKGSEISPSLIEEITGVQRCDRWFPLALLKVKSAVVAYFARERETVVTVVSRRDSLVILDDPGASDENRRAGFAAVRALGQAHRRNCAVDTSRLTPAELERHLRTIQVQSLILEGSKKARAHVRASSPARVVPGAVA